MQQDHDAADAPTTPEVVATLVAGHREFLAFLERRVGSRALAEDILQAAFVRGLEHAEALRDGESARAWFYRVLRNAVVDHHRRHAAAEQRLRALAEELDPDGGDPDPDVDREVCRCIGRLAATLKPEYAEAIRRVEVDGLAVKDFAVEAGISAGNAGVRVHRAREALRRQVARSCGTCAEHGCLDCTCGPVPGGGCSGGESV